MNRLGLFAAAALSISAIWLLTVFCSIENRLKSQPSFSVAIDSSAQNPTRRGAKDRTQNNFPVLSTLSLSLSREGEDLRRSYSASDPKQPGSISSALHDVSQISLVSFRAPDQTERSRDEPTEQRSSETNPPSDLDARWKALLSRSYPALAPSDEQPPIHLSDGDRQLLQQLPPACTFEILGDASNRPAAERRELIEPVTYSARQVQTKPAAAFEIIDENPTRPAKTQSDRGDLDAQSSSTPESVPSNPALPSQSLNDPSPNDPHIEVFSKSCYPSAIECAQCHQQIFDEWSSSGHAYASVSPMFQRFEDTINRLTQGTLGYFCLRCHAPVATTQELRRDQAIFDGPRVFREGITCVVCHRVAESYTKTNGERRIEPGDVFQPVYGTSDGVGVDLATKYMEFFKVKTASADKNNAQPIHNRAIQFEQLSQSDYCMSCHQVSVQPGIKLEVVWDQYRASPAYRNGVSCQDCHMSKVPGVDAGYSVGPAAIVSNRVVVSERKHSNHSFFGPGCSIAHPGVFPHNAAADRWLPDDWLQFDWRAGWGTETFERQLVQQGFVYRFPPVWQNVDDRYDAREILDANLKKLAYKRDLRRQVMENGSTIDGPNFACPPRVGQPLKFDVCVTNVNPGHNMPSGSLGAQPQLWLNVVLIGPDGTRLWESGYLDSQGDLADLHSQDVLDGKLPLDKQLFNLQTKFLTTNVKGTDREMYLPINFDVDQLPFIRPAPQPVTVINHPPLIRMEGHSLPPLGSRRAKYVVPASLIQTPGSYRLSVRMRSRLEPIYFMTFCQSTPEMIRSMNEDILDFHSYSTLFEVR